MKRRVPGFVAVLLLVVAAGSTRAQRSTTQRSTTIDVPAVVKVAVLSEGEGRSATGFLIDPGGYLLTSFRAIGEVDGAEGEVGALRADDNRYLIATQEGSAARFRYLARVVRGDVRRDMALLEIYGRLGGGALRGATFPVLSEGPVPGRGTSARIVGYPAGASRLRATPVGVTRVERDSYRQPAWIETDGRLDRGMLGGPLVGDDLRFSGIAVSTGGLVRPSARVPRSWRLGLLRGGLRGLEVEGVRRLDVGQELRDATYSPPRPGAEWLYYQLPSQRPLRVSIDPALGLRVVAGGRTVGRGRGAIELDRRVPASAVLAVARPETPTAFRLRATRDGEVAAAPAPAARPTSNDWLPGGGSAFVPRFGTARAATSTITGSMIDARTGQPIRGGTVIVSRRGVDLGALLARFLSGGIGERAFRRQLLGSASTNPLGRFQLRDLPPRQRASLAAFAPGYRPVVIEVSTSGRGESLSLRTLRMTR